MVKIIRINPEHPVNNIPRGYASVSKGHMTLAEPGASILRKWGRVFTEYAVDDEGSNAVVDIRLAASGHDLKSFAVQHKNEPPGKPVTITVGHKMRERLPMGFYEQYLQGRPDNPDRVIIDLTRPRRPREDA